MGTLQQPAQCMMGVMPRESTAFRSAPRFTSQLAALVWYQGCHSCFHSCLQTMPRIVVFSGLPSALVLRSTSKNRWVSLKASNNNSWPNSHFLHRSCSHSSCATCRPKLLKLNSPPWYCRTNSRISSDMLSASRLSLLVHEVCTEGLPSSGSDSSDDQSSCKGGGINKRIPCCGASSLSESLPPGMTTPRSVDGDLPASRDGETPCPVDTSGRQFLQKLSISTCFHQGCGSWLALSVSSRKGKGVRGASSRKAIFILVQMWI